jgi:hypothetical protein
MGRKIERQRRTAVQRDVTRTAAVWSFCKLTRLVARSSRHRETAEQSRSARAAQPHRLLAAGTTYDSAMPETPPDERMPAVLRDGQLRARRVSWWIRGPLMAAAVISTVLFAWTFTGPYQWIAMLEARLRGGVYSPELAAFLTFIVCTVPILIIVHAIARRLPPTAEERSRPPRARASLRR